MKTSQAMIIMRCICRASAISWSWSDAPGGEITCSIGINTKVEHGTCECVDKVVPRHVLSCLTLILEQQWCAQYVPCCGMMISLYASFGGLEYAQLILHDYLHRTHRALCECGTSVDTLSCQNHICILIILWGGDFCEDSAYVSTVDHQRCADHKGVDIVHFL